jgi:hypothetical protein
MTAFAISWIGVLVGALALFVFGALWFSVIFGKAYRRELGVPEPTDGGAALPPGPSLARALVGQFLAGLVIAFVLSWLIGDGGPGRGALVGLAGGILVAAALVQLHQFEGRSIRHLLLTTGYMILGITVVGAVVGAFPV